MNWLIFYLVSVVICAITVAIDLHINKVKVDASIKKQIVFVIFTPFLNTFIAIGFVLDYFKII